ncbi:energy-coupling factor ABC transporter permease [Candidatus Bathyarchaeota archaeon]|nr:energy-coupling factor ABC transporter permease [Candidatus Bathyarchaeota archaeon]
MHIPDGLITSPTSITLAVIMWIVSVSFLVWSWKKAKATYTRSITALLAISSAFIFAAQMINFPIVLGTSGHLVGGTFLAVLLGPYAAILSMTLVLTMQATFFADGGIVAFGMNLFNMAIIGGLSFFLVKLLTRSNKSTKRFISSVFIASWLSVMLGALITTFEVAPAFPGGISLILPPMMIFHALIGIGEGAITTVLITSIQRLNPSILGGLTLLRERTKL